MLRADRAHGCLRRSRCGRASHPAAACCSVNADGPVATGLALLDRGGAARDLPGRTALGADDLPDQMADRWPICWKGLLDHNTSRPRRSDRAGWRCRVFWPVVLGALVGAPAYLNGYAAPPLVAGLMEQRHERRGGDVVHGRWGGLSSVPAMAAVWALVKRRGLRGHVCAVRRSAGRSSVGCYLVVLCGGVSVVTWLGFGKVVTTPPYDALSRRVHRSAQH